MRKRIDRAGTFLEKTRELLKSDERSFLEIYKATDLPPSWLHWILRDKEANPSANRMQILYEFLTGEKLLNG